MRKTPENPPKASAFEMTPSKRVILALAVSAGLHGGFLFAEPIAQCVKDGIEWVLRAKPTEEEVQAFKDDLVNVLKDSEKLKTFNFAEFFLKWDRMDGFVRNDEDLQVLINQMRDIIEKYKAEKDQTKPRQMISKIMAEAPKHEPEQARLSKALTGEGGNCEAFFKYMVSILTELYPDMEIKIMEEKGEDGTPHILPIAKIDGKWVRIEPGLGAVRDLYGVAILTLQDFIKSAAGLKIEPKVFPVKGHTYTKPSTSNSSFNSGVDWSQLANRKANEHMRIVLKVHDSSNTPQYKKSSETDSLKAKRKFTEQEIVDAKLTGLLTVTPEISDLEAFRGSPIHLLVLDSRDKPDATDFPDLSPVLESHPKDASHNYTSNILRVRILGGIPDVKAFGGKDILLDRVVLYPQNIQQLLPFLRQQMFVFQLVFEAEGLDYFSTNVFDDIEVIDLVIGGRVNHLDVPKPPRALSRTKNTLTILGDKLWPNASGNLSGLEGRDLSAVGINTVYLPILEREGIKIHAKSMSLIFTRYAPGVDNENLREIFPEATECTLLIGFNDLDADSREVVIRKAVGMAVKAGFKKITLGNLITDSNTANFEHEESNISAALSLLNSDNFYNLLTKKLQSSKRVNLNIF